MTTRALCILILATSSLWGQAVRRGLSPVPPWAGPEGRMPGYYVYTDLQTGEYVLDYPDDLEALFKGEEPRTTKFVTVRFGRHLSKPAVEVEIEATAEGFQYRYTVANRADARQGIRSFMIVTAGTDYAGVLEHQAEKPWMTSPVSPNMRPHFEQSAIPLLGMSNKGMLVWWSGTPQGDAIAPGQARSGFVLKSEFRPGWTTAYAAGGESLAAPGHGYPPPIAAQLALVSGPEMEYHRVLTVGPRFPKDAPVEFVANDWAGMLRRLQVTGELADSVYAASILGILRATADSGFVPATASHSEPKTPLERTIATGLRLSLGLN